MVACDFDEIFFPFMTNFLKDHNDRFGTDHSIEEILTYELEQDIGIDFSEAVDRVYAFNNLDCLHIDPLEDSVDAVHRLSGKYDLEIVTARHPMHAGNTKKWASMHYGDIFRGMAFIGHPGAVENYRTKAEVCREIGAIALIDDSLSHVSLAAESGVEGLLFGNYPWNQTENGLPSGVIRRQNWQEVLQHFGV